MDQRDYRPAGECQSFVPDETSAEMNSGVTCLFWLIKHEISPHIIHSEGNFCDNILDLHKS